MEQTFTTKLIPSSYTLSPSGSSKFYITNADNIYSDTSSNEYATIHNNYGSAYSGSIQLHFDLTELEHFEEASSVNSFSLLIKVGNCYNASNLDWIVPYVENGGTTYSPSFSEYSHTISWGLNPDATGKSITSVNTSVIESHLIGASDLWITVNCKQSSDNYTNYLYICGAELNITYTITKNYNKFVYGNETLIDLTSDTATEADVVSGKTFHLANGSIGVGTLSPSVATAVGTVVDATTLKFSNLAREPSWFFGHCWVDADGSKNVGHIMFRYDGSTFAVRRVTSSSSSTNVYLGGLGNYTASFAYSNGELTITTGRMSGTNFSSVALWELYYI